MSSEGLLRVLRKARTHLAVVLTVLFCLAQIAFLFHWYGVSRGSSEAVLTFERHSAAIAKFDLDLTMSARLYAATGQAVWRERYEALVEPLAKTLEASLQLTDHPVARQAVLSVSSANDRLIAFEEESFHLVSRGNEKAALELLMSEAYQQQKEIYKAGVERALDVSRLAVQGEAAAHRYMLISMIVAMFTLMLLTSEIWRRRSIERQERRASEINEALEQERELNGLQRQFVSMVSHEFRTPLAIIQGRARRLTRRADAIEPDQIRDNAHSLHQAVSRLTQLMESVLNLSRMEEGRIDFKPNQFDIRELIEDVVSGFFEVNPDRSFDLRLDGLPDVVSGDPNLIRQIISNLISNAIKYSDEGSSIRVKGRLEANEIQVAVQDHGVGIPPAELEKLFQRFFRASSSVGIAGTGIGLHLAMHLVHLHNGRMDVTSELGKGSTFCIYLPHQATTHVKNSISRSLCQEVAA